MKIVYIAHPIAGDVVNNLASIRKIVKTLNLTNPNIVPFVPYYVDVASMDDSIPEQRARGIANDHAILYRKGMVDEMWLYGKSISAGMRQEIIIALQMKIPVVCSTHELWAEYKTIAENFEKFGA